MKNLTEAVKHAVQNGLTVSFSPREQAYLVTVRGGCTDDSKLGHKRLFAASHIEKSNFDLLADAVERLTDEVFDVVEPAAP